MYYIMNFLNEKNNILFFEILNKLITTLIVNSLPHRPVHNCVNPVVIHDDKISIEQAKYTEIAKTFPFSNMIAIINSFDDKFDNTSYINTNQTPGEKIQTMNNLLMYINKNTTDKWIEQLNLLYKIMPAENSDDFAQRIKDLGELKQSIYIFQGILNKICLRHIVPNSPLLQHL